MNIHCSCNGRIKWVDPAGHSHQRLELWLVNGMLPTSERSGVLDKNVKLTYTNVCSDAPANGL
jgi:hypothetical protein